jgi:DNA-binding IclR family transcriptional regulator
MGKRKDLISGAVAEKALKLLEILAEGAHDSVSSLARKADMSRYKTARLLACLESKGLVEFALESGKYAVASEADLFRQKLEKHSGRASAIAALQELPANKPESNYRIILQDARPVLESLARRHNEAMYLTILKGNEVLFLDMVDCHRQIKAEPLIGLRFPFFSNAAGKVMRAIDSWDLLEKICKRWRRGQGCQPELADLQAELELIRQKGVAVDCGGLGEGVITVAVAVRDYTGKVIGALTMIGPSVRFLSERLEREIIPSLQLSGEMLSSKFGYARP